LSKDFSKLLICGGYYPYIDSCEVINLASSASSCKKPPNFPVKVYYAIGGLGFKGNPFLCGGLQKCDYSNKCYSLDNNEWVSSAGMISVRVEAAAAQLEDGKLLITGCYDEYQSDLKSAEMLTEEGWVSTIPPRRYLRSLHGHC
jgi:hypothetical protein